MKFNQKKFKHERSSWLGFTSRIIYTKLFLVWNYNCFIFTGDGAAHDDNGCQNYVFVMYFKFIRLEISFLSSVWKNSSRCSIFWLSGSVTCWKVPRGILDWLLVTCWGQALVKKRDCMSFSSMKRKRGRPKRLMKEVVKIYVIYLVFSLAKWRYMISISELNYTTYLSNDITLLKNNWLWLGSFLLVGMNLFPAHSPLSWWHYTIILWRMHQTWQLPKLTYNQWVNL